MSELGLVKRQFGHRARLALGHAEIRVIDDQAHAASNAQDLWIDLGLNAKGLPSRVID